MCVYGCVYVCVGVCTYVCTYVLYVHVCLCVRAEMHTVAPLFIINEDIYLCVCMYVCVYLLVCTYVCACMLVAMYM